MEVELGTPASPMQSPSRPDASKPPWVAPVVDPVIAVRDESARRARWPFWACHAALFGLLAFDFLRPSPGPVSMGVLALLTFLVLPWAWLLFSTWRASRPDAHWLPAWGFTLSITGLAAAVLSAKWWLLLHAPSLEGAGYTGSARSYTVVLLGLLTLGVLGSGRHAGRLAALVVDHPARLIALSFGLCGLVGGFALSLPVSLQRVHELSVLDNMFMAFSAVCVTGLGVNTVATTYTWAGQAVLCVLIQVGGLGIMVLSAAVAVLTGRRLRVRRSAVLAEIVDVESLTQLRRLIIAIVVSTLSIEAVAASVLYFLFVNDPGMFARAAGAAVVHGPLWAAVFHAVSAFCNAGFSTFEAGLIPYMDRPSVLGVMMVLIVAGGIGFPVLYELARRLVAASGRRRLARMSLHARVALRATVILLTVMLVGYLLLEWHGALSGLGWFGRVVAAAFQSVSCRTAGFNVIDMGALGPAALMLTCMVMFIGTNSGSCGGGIKTTTVAALFAGLRSELQSRPAFLLDRVLPAATIRKAVGVSFLSIGIVSVALFSMLLLEQHPPLELAFEVFSAFSTTGLSTGITPRLSPAGKVLILLTMYVGRIGPLTLALAVARRNEPVHMQLPAERVLIG